MRILLAILALLVFLGFSATVVKNEAPAAKKDGGEIQVFFSADKFDAEGYVDSIWDSRALPYMKEKAVDLLELREAIAKDAAAAGEKYGYRAVAEHNPYNYTVKARVKILSANVKSRNGRAEIDVQPYDGTPDAVMLLGPIFKGTAIRDMLDFISFDDFKNQVEFAKLATQLNLHVRDHVLAPVGLPGDGGVGREFDMTAATTHEPGKSIFTVVPVVLEPVGE